MPSVGKQYIHMLMIKLGIAVLALVFLAIVTVFIALGLLLETHISFWQVVAMTLGPWVTALCIGIIAWIHCDKELPKEHDGVTLLTEMAANTVATFAVNFIKDRLSNKDKAE